LDAAVKRPALRIGQPTTILSLGLGPANRPKPTLGAWMATNDHTSELFTMQRNPYFFAVDSAGNHSLHRHGHASSVPSLRARCVHPADPTNGRDRHAVPPDEQISNLPVYKAGEAKGDYKTLLGAARQCMSAFAAILRPRTSRSPSFFSQRDARIAMSLAINRDNMNQLVYNGFAHAASVQPNQSVAAVL